MLYYFFDFNRFHASVAVGALLQQACVARHPFLQHDVMQTEWTPFASHLPERKKGDAWRAHGGGEVLDAGVDADEQATPP